MRGGAGVSYKRVGGGGSAQDIYVFFGDGVGSGRGYGLDVHDGCMGLGICGGVLVIEGKGVLCEVSVNRCEEDYLC